MAFCTLGAGSTVSPGCKAFLKCTNNPWEQLQPSGTGWDPARVGAWLQGYGPALGLGYPSWGSAVGLGGVGLDRSVLHHGAPLLFQVDGPLLSSTAGRRWLSPHT